MDYPEKTYEIDDNLIKIVSTSHTLGGVPRVDGHRIAVYHIRDCYRSGISIEEMASEDVYPTLSTEEIRAALRYAIDNEAAVDNSAKPDETSLHIKIPFDSDEGGPQLTVFNETEKVASEVIRADDLPDEYSERELYLAWQWYHEAD